VVLWKTNGKCRKWLKEGDVTRIEEREETFLKPFTLSYIAIFIASLPLHAASPRPPRNIVIYYLCDL